MTAKSNLFLILTIITIMFFFFTCDTLFVLTTLVPMTTDPAYELSGDTNSVEILVIGDSGSGTEDQYAVASWMKTYAGEHPIAFTLLAGDNFYEHGVSSLDDPLFNTRFENVYNENISDLPFFSVLGNHDMRGNIDAQILYTDVNPQWKMPFLYYNFTYTLADNTKIDFFALDSNVIIEGGSMSYDQQEWFYSVLSTSDADWKIVYAHHPLYSNGDHGNNGFMIHTLQELFEEYNVDVFIGGHDHDLQVIEPVNGVQYLVSGAAGKIRDTSVNDNTLYGKGVYGFMTLEISSSILRIKVIVKNAVVDYEMIIEK